MRNRARFLQYSLIIAFTISLTIVGFFMTLARMSPPLVLTAWWFPFALLAKRITGSELLMLLVAVVQFPLFGGVVLLALRNQKTGLILTGLGLVYLITVALAMMVT